MDNQDFAGLIYNVYLERALIYGLTYSEFLQINPKILYIHQTAYLKKLEQKELEKDNFAWLQGVYIAQAIGSCFSKRSKYPKKPYGSKNTGEDKPLTDAEKFEMWASAFNHNKGLK